MENLRTIVQTDATAKHLEFRIDTAEGVNEPGRSRFSAEGPQ